MCPARRSRLPRRAYGKSWPGSCPLPCSPRAGWLSSGCRGMPTVSSTGASCRRRSPTMKLLPLDSPELIELVAGWLGKADNYKWLDSGSGSVTISTAGRTIACCSTCWQPSTRKSDMSDSRNLEDQLIRLFAEQLHVEVPSVATDLIDTGLVDSLTFVEFLAQLEAGFGVRVSLEDLEIDRFRTISSIAGFIAAKTAQLTLSSNHGRA